MYRTFIKLKIFLTLVVLSFTSFLYAQNVKEYIPERAFQYRNELYTEILGIIPDLANYNYVPALIEHESCISLKNSKCWSADVELSNKREYSVGFFQIARAWSADGKERMNTLASLKKIYPTRLAMVNWGNLKGNADYQFKVGLLLIHDNLKGLKDIKDPWSRMAMQDRSYNSGMGNLRKDIKACSLSKGCNPQLYFNNVENFCTGSKKPIPQYGNRSICDIRRNHTRDVFFVRMPKYEKQYFNEQYLKEHDYTGHPFYTGVDKY